MRDAFRRNAPSNHILVRFQSFGSKHINQIGSFADVQRGLDAVRNLKALRHVPGLNLCLCLFPGAILGRCRDRYLLFAVSDRRYQACFADRCRCLVAAAPDDSCFIGVCRGHFNAQLERFALLQILVFRCSGDRNAGHDLPRGNGDVVLIAFIGFHCIRQRNAFNIRRAAQRGLLHLGHGHTRYCRGNDYVIRNLAFIHRAQQCRGSVLHLVNEVPFLLRRAF